MASIITFACGRNDEPIEVQLEPEALLFKVLPGNEISFKGIAPDNGDFEWSLYVDHKNQGIRVCPDKWPHEITIFENGVLLEDWHKYM